MISDRLERLVEEMVDRGVQFDDAVREFENSQQLINTQPGALQQYGACLFRLKQPGKAVPVFQSLLAMLHGYFNLSQGAVPIIRKNVVEGAVGVSGGTALQDEEIAQAGAAAL